MQNETTAPAPYTQPTIDSIAEKVAAIMRRAVAGEFGAGLIEPLGDLEFDVAALRCAERVTGRVAVSIYEAAPTVEQTPSGNTIMRQGAITTIW